MQDQSISVFEEALLYNGRDLSFDDGWAGICWSLIVLLKERVVNADYMELVGGQHQSIINILQNLDTEDRFSLTPVFQLIRFLSEYQDLFPSDIHSILKTSIELAETRLYSILRSWKSVSPHIRSKVARSSDLVDIIVRYLQCCELMASLPNQEVLSQYKDCYQTEQLPNDLRLGLLLERLDFDQKMIEQNLSFGLLQMKQPTTLRRTLDVLQILRHSEQSGERRRLLLSLENRLGVSQQLDTYRLIKYLPADVDKVSYAYGISRLVLYLLCQEHPHILLYLD